MELHNEFGPIASFWWGKIYTISIASADLFEEQKSLFDRPCKYVNSKSTCSFLYCHSITTCATTTNNDTTFSMSTTTNDNDNNNKC